MGWLFRGQPGVRRHRDKVTCIKYMRMSARLYTHSALLFHYVPFFIYYLPSLAGMALLLGGTLLQGLILWLMLLGIRLAGEAFQLLIFDRTGKVLCRNMLFSWIVIGVGLGGGYGLTAAGISLAPCCSILWLCRCIWFWGRPDCIICLSTGGMSKSFPVRWTCST